jgi:hypothetical protein
MEYSEIDQRCRLALVHARRYAAQIIDGAVSPYDGAHLIASQVGDCHNFLGLDLDLVDLLGAFSGYSDEYQETLLHPDKKAEIDADVVQSAREFIQLASGRDFRAE